MTNTTNQKDSSAASGERAEYWDTTNGPEGRYAFYRLKVGDGDIPQTLYATPAPQAATPSPGGWAVILEDDTLDVSHGPTKLLLLAEYWKREAQQARAALTQQASPEAPTLILTDEEIGKVRAAKRVMVDALIFSNLRYKTCGAISHRLEKLIDGLASPVAAPEAPAREQCTYPNCSCIGGGVFKPCVKHGAPPAATTASTHEGEKA